MNNPTRIFLTAVGLFVLFAIGLAWIQYSTPDLADNDGFYHIKFAWLMRTQGLKPDFKWLPLSILNPEDFYDHHFLYHVLLIPFTFTDLLVGAKWSAILIPALSFLAIWHLLHASGTPEAWLWSLGLLGLSQAFLFRMVIPRAQSLSLGLLALGMLWIIREKNWHLLALGFLFVWSYNAFPLLAAMAAFYTLSVYIAERRIAWKPLVFVIAGIALGLVINPYFPQNIVFTINHILPKLSQPQVSGLGNEWLPYSSAQILENSFPSLVLFVSATMGIGLSGRKMEKSTLFAFFTAILFGFMFLRARRFVEYFPPFALIFAAFAWTPILDQLIGKFSESSHSGQAARSKRWLFALMLVLVAASSYYSINEAIDIMRTSKPAEMYQDSALWLQNNTPDGSLVFQTDWDDFPRLFFYNTSNTYLAGLDPTYFQLYDLHLYNLWVKITRGDVKDPSATILENFGTRYIHSDLKHTAFLTAAEADPQMHEVLRDEHSVVFEIQAP